MSLSLLPMVIGLPVSLELSRQDEQPTRPIVEISEAGSREVWWRVEWARIVGLDGSWSVHPDDEFTFLEPEDPGCVLRILARSSGRVFDYPMRSEGQVALGLGWIMVSTGGPLDCASRETGLALSEVPAGPRTLAGYRDVGIRFIEKVVVHGSEPFLFLPPDPILSLKVWRRLPPGGSSSRVEVQGVLGDGYRFPTTDEADWFTLAQRGEHGRPGTRLRVADRVPAF